MNNGDYLELGFIYCEDAYKPISHGYRCFKRDKFPFMDNTQSSVCERIFMEVKMLHHLEYLFTVGRQSDVQIRTR